MIPQNQQLYDNAAKVLRILDESGVDVIREMGIKGMTGEPRSCLVAKYLNETIGGTWSVGCSTADGWESEGVDGIPGVRDISLPRNVKNLIMAFDEGLYPDLKEAP